MICKEDVVNWFSDLKSYNRIDTMCVLLNMCLPFELRFLGTYLEELGRRDAPELRGAELKVNNPQEFIADIASGEPTDRRIRRKMALFLALFRTCNHTYANELFKTLEGWGDRDDLQRLFEEDVLQELLLVYTMATNHPVFSFEQRLHCGEIFTKLKSCEPKPAQRSHQQQDSREDSLEHQHQPAHHQHQHQHQHQPVSQHQHHQQQQQSRHQSMDSLHSNSPQQSPIQQQQHQQQQQQQQQQQHHQQQHQPVHVQNSTPPPAPGTATLHPALPPNAPMSMQLVPQSGATTTIALSYPGQPGLTQVITNDGSLTTAHYLETLPQLTQLPLQPDFTIPPPGPPSTGVPARWAHSVYQQLSYPPPASSPHLSNPSSPIHSRTASPTRIHPSSVQHRISRNQQNDQQQQQQQQSQVQMQSLKTVDEDQTMLMLSQMHMRNGMRPTQNTLPRQSKQSYVSQPTPYHHQQPQQQQQQQQQQQHHSQRGDGTSGGSGNYHSLNHSMKGGMMMDIINHQPKSTGSDSGSSIGSDVSPPETPGVVSVSAGGGVPHARSSNRSNMRNVNGRLEKLNYSQHHQQQQQFAGGELMVTSVGQHFLTTGTTNGAAMSSNGNNGASGSSVVSGPLLISPAAAAPPPPPGSTGTTGLLLSTQSFATGPYAGGATAYQAVSAAPHLVQQHRQLTTATLPHGTPFRPAPYPPAMQQTTSDSILYQYHPPAGATVGAGSVPPSSLPFLPTPPPPGPGPASSTASTQTSLPNLRSSPSQPVQVAVATSQQAVSSLGLLQAKGPGTGYGVTTPTLPLVGTAFGTGVASCYNCGSQKHAGLDCPEASMEDMTRNSNFTLDYNTTSSGPSSVAASGGTLGVASNNNNNLNPSTIISVPPPIDHAPASLDRDNSTSTSSSSSSSASSSSGVSKSNNNANSANNNGNNSSNSSNNSNNSSLDVPSSLTSASSSSMAAAATGEPTGGSGASASVAAAAAGSNSSGGGSSSSSSSSSTGSSTTNSNSNNLVNASGK